MTPLVTRLPVQLLPDSRRTITRLFSPGDNKRCREIVERAIAFPEDAIIERLAEIEQSFGGTHPQLPEIFLEHFELMRGAIPDGANLSEAQKRFIGACFTMEYAIEAVALFNPSVVPALDQGGVPPGSIRFLMSLRATGEGHLSSIVFRTGTIDADGEVVVDPPGSYSQALKAIVPEHFRKSTYLRNLRAMGLSEGPFQAVLDQLPEEFSREDLSQAIEKARQARAVSGFVESNADTLIGLSRVNYSLQLTQTPVRSQAEIVIFPFSDIERHGIEDLRMVQFIDDDGTVVHYGTFTAFNGERIFPQLMEFRGAGKIEISLITGECARNKGMALFPRRIGGKYAMIARIDNENLHYMESDDVLFWDKAQPIEAPKYLWQIMLIGNCGSPIETEAGWLLLTHGVGPMRRYCIGASLLDLDEPWRLIGQTREPLIVPTDDERWGYVPNVVYSCGAMLHGRKLIVPYALSDLATTAARIDLDQLLGLLAKPS